MCHAAILGTPAHTQSLNDENPPKPAHSAGRGTTNACPRKWRPDDLRRTEGSVESCCLPALTRFTDFSRTGSDHHLPEQALGDTLSNSLARQLASDTFGGVRERPNRHAWKACEGRPSVGSNPTSSANQISNWRVDSLPTQPVRPPVAHLGDDDQDNAGHGGGAGEVLLAVVGLAVDSDPNGEGQHDLDLSKRSNLGCVLERQRERPRRRSKQ